MSDNSMVFNLPKESSINNLQNLKNNIGKSIMTLMNKMFTISLIVKKYIMRNK